ncbi:nitroreductase A [Pasteurellaceae bacterium RH1A]|nr:nitroreductase A [Pasteurellaceae bacterium RH1A]
MQSKPTLDTILAHRSIRKFTNKPIAPNIMQTLLEAGSRASTSNNLQCVSVIRVTDAALRAELASASGMKYVAECAEFWVFCIDFQKHKQICPNAQLDWAEVSLIGAVDTGIFAQNVLLAAESLGLGGVYIGALRNQIEQVADLLKLPQYCVPLVGLCLGYPAHDPALKPRLPQALFCYENAYPENLDEQVLDSYNQTLSQYYLERTGTALVWQAGLEKALNQPVRPHILPFFHKQGLLKK